MKRSKAFATWLAHNHDNLKIDPRIRNSETLMHGYYEASRINLDYKNVKRKKELSAEEFNKREYVRRQKANKKKVFNAIKEAAILLTPILVVFGLYAAAHFKSSQDFGQWALLTSIGWPIAVALFKVLVLPYLTNKKGGSL